MVKREAVIAARHHRLAAEEITREADAVAVVIEGGKLPERVVGVPRLGAVGHHPLGAPVLRVVRVTDRPVALALADEAAEGVALEEGQVLLAARLDQDRAREAPARVAREGDGHARGLVVDEVAGAIVEEVAVGLVGLLDAPDLAGGAVAVAERAPVEGLFADDAARLVAVECLRVAARAHDGGEPLAPRVAKSPDGARGLGDLREHPGAGVDEGRGASERVGQARGEAQTIIGRACGGAVGARALGRAAHGVVTYARGAGGRSLSIMSPA